MLDYLAYVVGAGAVLYVIAWFGKGGAACYLDHTFKNRIGKRK